MQIYNGEDVYTYDVESSYENDNYRVSLTNQMNNHEQIILRNSDGVYVLTPSLNKSFKFQSNWPENNSQVYLLQSLLTDINKDSKIKLEEKNNKYILKTKINYSNNKNLVNQKIYMDKKLNFEKVEVFDKTGNKQIKMIFNSIDTKASFNNKYFSTSENMKSANMKSEDDKETNSKESTQNNANKQENKSSSNSTNEQQTQSSENNVQENNTQSDDVTKDSKEDDRNNVSESQDNSTDTQTTLLEDTVYPMYLPSGTYLSTEESVDKEDGERIILTFAGETPFILVEETVSKSDEMEIIPVNGEPTIIMDTVAALSDSSVNFISNGVEYYLASEDMSMQEILEVAESISSVPIMK